VVPGQGQSRAGADDDGVGVEKSRESASVELFSASRAILETLVEESEESLPSPEGT